MTRTILIVSALATLAGCAPTAKVESDNRAWCAAMRGSMPIQYHAKTDAPDDIERIRVANARYEAICQ